MIEVMSRHAATEERRAARSSWTVEVFRQGEEPGDDPGAAPAAVAAVRAMLGFQATYQYVPELAGTVAVRRTIGRSSIGRWISAAASPSATPAHQTPS